MVSNTLSPLSSTSADMTLAVLTLKLPRNSVICLPIMPLQDVGANLVSRSAY